jgi:hypothetical protein
VNKIIDIETTLDESGGPNDSVTRRYTVDTAIGAFQWSIGGATRSADIVLEARLADRFAWRPYGVGATDVGSGNALEELNLAPLSTIRVRAVNNDETVGNTADINAVVVTP